MAINLGATNLTSTDGILKSLPVVRLEIKER
jgi:hypothetical protein